MIKKRSIWIRPIIAVIASLLLFTQSCKKSKVDSPWSVPTITTSEVLDITETTVIAGGDITSNGGTAVTESGVCWSTNDNPTIEDYITKDGSDSGIFSSNISGLVSNTTYYVRAYATNSEGTGYGSSVTFTTRGLASLTTNEMTDITLTTAVGGGNVITDGGSSVTERGICWGTQDNPTLVDNKTNDGNGIGAFTSNLTNLVDGSIYYVRAYATNMTGTSYGNTVSFSSQPATVPALTTVAISNIAQTTASSGGIITSSGGATILSKGVCWGINPNPTINNNRTNDVGSGSFNSNLSGLSVGTTYYIRAYATNKVGTSYGNELQFTTLDATAPILTTNATSNITQTTASSGGNISSDGASTIIERGVCWSTSANPTISDFKITNGTGTGAFTSALTGLSGGVTYYVRAYATNGVGTGYGNGIQFTTLAATLPVLTTNSITGVTKGSGTGGGNISSNGASSIIERGVCWSTTSNPTISNNKTVDGTGTGAFASTLTGLTAGNTYYVRAYAKNSAGTGYGTQVTFTVAFAVGQAYQGGIIAYILQSGDPGYDANVKHGLIAATADETNSIRWYKGSYLTTGATGSVVGAGGSNTTTIINAQGATATTYAAGVARANNGGGYTDWYLPNAAELNYIYNNSNAIGGFSSSYYWSSTEASNVNAYYKDFFTGSIKTIDKATTCRVRAIRKF